LSNPASSGAAPRSHRLKGFDVKRPARWWISIALTGLPALFAASANAAGLPINIGQRYQIQSRALSAPVSYLVHTPKFYEGTDQAYPIVILLDGEQHFAHVSASMDFLAEQGRIPAMILVGVNNVNRAANLSPPLPSPASTSIPNDPTTPNADKFLGFISDELIPEIDRGYRTRPYRVLIGHSSGGLFVLYSLLQRPDVFNGYVAISPAIDPEYETLIDAMPAFLSSHKDLRADVFVAIGNEQGRMLANTWRLSARFAEKPPRTMPGIRWQLSRFPEDDHGTVSLRAMEQGLRSVFDGWYVEESDARTLFEKGGVAALQKHYAEVSQRMGYAVPVPRGGFAATIGALRRGNRPDDARLVLEQAIAAYPDDPEFYFILGQEYFGRDRARALEYFTKSLQASATEYRDPIVGAYKVDASKLLPEITLPAQALKAYPGTYRVADDSRTIQLRNGALTMSGPTTGACEMRFLSELAFYCGPAQGTFEKGRDGRLRSLTLRNEGFRYTLTRSR
jgi:predicted alpha/beta superfamily hydrolase